MTADHQFWAPQKNPRRR